MNGIRAKFSLFTMAIVFVAIGTTLYLPLSTYLDFKDKIDQRILLKEERLLSLLQISQALYLAGAEKELDEILRNSLGKGELDYYIVYRNGEAIYTIPPDNPLATGNTYAERSPFIGLDLIDKYRSERSERLSAEIVLTLGIDKRDKSLLINALKESGAGRVILEDILIVIGLAAFAFWIHTRDILQIKRDILLSGRLSEAVTNRLPHSEESEAILASIKGLSQTSATTHAQNTVLKNQVLPALKAELFSGKEPPYTFNCTLVRTDINNFTKIFNSPLREDFSNHINLFFTELTEIVSRYHGLIYEFVGDEAIFYFKDPGSMHLACFALRDINEIAKRTHSLTQKKGYPFTVKSSLTYDTLRFAKLVDGYSLSGAPLIETVRILSQVTEKETNHIYLGERHLKSLPPGCHTADIGEFNLKGYSQKAHLFEIQNQKSISKILQDLHDFTTANTKTDLDRLEIISDFRSDEDVIAILTWTIHECRNSRPDVHQKICSELRKLTVYKSKIDFTPLLAAWLELIQDQAESQTDSEKKEAYSRVSSAIVMLFSRLVRNLESSLSVNKLLRSDNPRLVANTLELLTSQPRTESLYDDDMISQLQSSPINRVAANAIILNLVRQTYKDDLARLRAYKRAVIDLNKMISDTKNPERQASGIFAIGESVRILKNEEPIYYSTRIELQELATATRKFLGNTHSMINRQAAIACKKSGLPIKISA